MHGFVAGSIRVPNVTLWPDGYVDGQIIAEEAYILGHLKGRAFIRTVSIGASATVDGQVFHHTVDVAKGACIMADTRFPSRPVSYFDEFNLQLQQMG